MKFLTKLEFLSLKYKYPSKLLFLPCFQRLPYIDFEINKVFTVNPNDYKQFNYDKLILGNPYYGYEWPSNGGDKGASTTNDGTAVIFSTAESKALSYGKLWDSDSQTPWYRYQNPSWFQTWYDDSLSLSNKYDFV